MCRIIQIFDNLLSFYSSYGNKVTMKIIIHLNAVMDGFIGCDTANKENQISENTKK